MTSEQGPDETGNERDETLRTLGLVGQIGWRMVCCIVAGFAAGVYLDGLVGVRGPFLAVFLVAGVAGGFWSCYRLIMASYEKECPNKNKTHGDPT